MDEDVADPHPAARGACPRRAAVHERHLDPLAAPLALEPTGGAGESQELHHIAGDELREVALERDRSGRGAAAGGGCGHRLSGRAHCFPQRTSPTTRPRVSTAPRITRRLYQPSASTCSP